MLAVKQNKVYTITESEKASYLAQGYDITDAKGNIIERSPFATVPYAEYKKVVDELEALKAKQKKAEK